MPYLPNLNQTPKDVCYSPEGDSWRWGGRGFCLGAEKTLSQRNAWNGDESPAATRFVGAHGLEQEPINTEDFSHRISG